MPEPFFDPMDHFTVDEDVEAFVKLAGTAWEENVGACNTVRVIEVGVWAGYLTRHLAGADGVWLKAAYTANRQAYDNLWRVSDNDHLHIFAVDNWQAVNFGNQHPEDPVRVWVDEHGADAAFATFCRNMGDLLFRRVFPLRGDSLLWASAWPEGLPIDLVIIDANKAETKQDIEAWTPRVREGGIIAGHDFLHQDVYLAVHETGNYHEATSNVWWRRKGE